jgi:phosphoribosylaminoimidazole (AIR) synthetase
LEKVKKIISGIVKGCSEAGCGLVGGETAEMPGTYEKNKFDLAGFAVGVVEKKFLLTKNKIKKNDIVLAVPSAGLHSNGYSLVRYILKKNKLKKKYRLVSTSNIKKELIKPTKIYVKEVVKLIYIFFFDYIAIHKLNLEKVKKIISGIVKGCSEAGCGLVGGETAEMPGTYEKNKFDLAGFAVGVVEKKFLLTKNKIKKNDIVLAVPSAGLHSNGYSLVRYILKKNKLKKKGNYKHKKSSLNQK